VRLAPSAAFLISVGYWKNYPKPVESNKPLIEVCPLLPCAPPSPCLQLNVTGFHIPSQKTADDLEYRLVLSILPLRCYLDGNPPPPSVALIAPSLPQEDTSIS
jgi:hypothetical protein